MNRQTIPLGRILGIAIGLDYSWFLVDRHIFGAGRRNFVVEEKGQAVGFVTLHHLKQVPQNAWPTTTIAEAMTPISEMKSVAPQTEIWDALAQMDHNGVNQLPVIAGGKILGVLSREDVISYLRTLREFEAPHTGNASGTSRRVNVGFR